MSAAARDPLPIGAIIGTEAGRDALPVGTIVRSAQGTIAARDPRPNRGQLFGTEYLCPWDALELPITVLWPGDDEVAGAPAVSAAAIDLVLTMAQIIASRGDDLPPHMTAVLLNEIDVLRAAIRNALRDPHDAGGAE